MSSVKLFDFTEKDWSPIWKGKTLACSCHTHSDQSLDGGSTVEDMVFRAAELDYTHFTLSEHGNVNSAASIWQAVEKVKKKTGKTIKPFHSVEGYIRFPEDAKDTHITIGFKTREAFAAYSRLTEKLFSPEQLVVKFGDVKPVMTKEQFEELAQYGITVGTGCIGSWLNSLIFRGDTSLGKNGNNIPAAKKRLDWMINLVGKDNVYDEWIVDDLSKKYVKPVYDDNRRIIKPARLEENECLPWFHGPDVGKETNMARREYVTGPLKIKPIASLDAHYARKRDKVVQDAKNFGSDWVMSNFQHLKGAEEFAHEAKVNEGLDDKFIEELIDNTHEYASQFDSYEFGIASVGKNSPRGSVANGWLMPVYTENTAWVWDTVKELGKVDLNDPIYLERLKYEIKVFSDNGVSDFLNYVRLVREIVQLAEKHGILCNVRGSAGGSLVYYALGISVIDPIKFELPFERHLTIGRIKSGSIPDADLDFSDKDKIMEVLRQEYGSRMLPISTDSLLKPRSAIKDAERALLGGVRVETEILTKSMPSVPQGVDETDWLFGYEDENGDHVDGFFEKSEELQKYAKANPEIWDLVVSMCGVQRQKSRHSCGVVILPENAANYLPLYRVGGKGGELATAYNPKDLEYIGGVKIDILGVKKMLTIQECMKLVKERHGVELQWGEFEHDEEVYKNIYWTAKTEATFQTNTPGISELGLKTRPKSIVEIGNLIALYRPSCLDATPSWDPEFNGNLVDYYVAGKNNVITPKYIHDDLIPIYGYTGSSPVFQEQILRTFRDIGGLTYEQAELVRRAIGKKDAKSLADEGNKLREQCLKRGWSERQATELFEMIQASSRYGFNLAHSISYAIVSYNTAYLKHKYPLEFWAAELSCEYENEDKLRAYADHIGEMLSPPDILRSHHSSFTIEGDKLRAPLSILKGVGESVVQDIQTLLNNSLEDLGLARKPEKVSKRRSSTNVHNNAQ